MGRGDGDRLLYALGTILVGGLMGNLLNGGQLRPDRVYKLDSMDVVFGSSWKDCALRLQ